MKVLSLIHRNSAAPAAVKIKKVSLDEIEPIIRANVAAEAHLMTDETHDDKRLRLDLNAKHDRVLSRCWRIRPWQHSYEHD